MACQTADECGGLGESCFPIFVFGLIADVQYADLADGTSFDGTEKRHYRRSLEHARAAALAFAASGCTTVVQIGDLIDGKNNPAASTGEPAAEACKTSRAACATALEALASPAYNLLHVRGNHENYNFTLGEQKQLFLLPPSAQPFPDAECFYYSAQPHPQWKFLILDAYDVSLARPRGSQGFAEAQRLLKAHNPNPCAWGDKDAPPGDYFAGVLGSPRARFMPFNGGLGAGQLAWLRASLASARAARQRIVIFSHVPFNPTAKCLYQQNVFSTLMYNYEEVLAELSPYADDTVAGVFCGHNHDGSFGRDSAGIPHWTLPSPLVYDGAHMVVEVHEDSSSGTAKLRLHAAGECARLMEALQAGAGEAVAQGGEGFLDFPLGISVRQRREGGAAAAAPSAVAVGCADTFFKVGHFALRALSLRGAMLRLALPTLVEARKATADIGGIELVAWDPCDLRTLEAAVRGFRTILLVPPLDGDTVSFASTVVSIGARLGARVIVVGGQARPGGTVFPAPQSAAIEALAASTGGATVLRLPFFLENLLWHAQRICLGAAFSYPVAADVRFPAVACADVGNFVAALATLPQDTVLPGLIDLSDAAPRTTMRELATFLAASLGRAEVPYLEAGAASFSADLEAQCITAAGAQEMLALWRAIAGQKDQETPDAAFNDAALKGAAAFTSALGRGFMSAEAWVKEHACCFRGPDLCSVHPMPPRPHAVP